MTGNRSQNLWPWIAMIFPVLQGSDSECDKMISYCSLAGGYLIGQNVIKAAPGKETETCIAISSQMGKN